MTTEQPVQELEIFVRTGCSACEEAIQVCKEFLSSLPNSQQQQFSLKVINLSDLSVTDKEYAETKSLADRLPVIKIAGDEVTCWGVTKDQLAQIIS